MHSTAFDTAAAHSAAASRADGWRRDYSHCACDRHSDHCPHCGDPASDSTHRGRCHARVVD